MIAVPLHAAHVARLLLALEHDLFGYADRERGRPCPGIVRDEARAVAEGTLAIRRADGIQGALEALVGRTIGHVVVHEARHRLDAEDWGFDTPPPCTDCGLDGRARIEASAYLAVLGSREATVGWVQACAMLAAAEGGSSVVAARAVLEAVGAPCDGEVPADLAERARAVDQRWFGRTGETTVTGIPARVRFALPDPARE